MPAITTKCKSFCADFDLNLKTPRPARVLPLQRIVRQGVLTGQTQSSARN